ncbi:MAG TPA: helix-turn-helix domain-containing protein [Chloroflexota bacterium]
MTGRSGTLRPPTAPRGDENAALGAGIRRERVRQSLTLAQLADRAGLSASALSQIERGVTDPSISSLRRISTALGVPFFQFLAQNESPDPVVRRADRRTIVFPGRALQYQLLTPSPQGTFEVLSLELAPGAASGPAATSHDSDECLVVLNGAVDVELAGRWYQLEAGDAMTIPRNLPHLLSNKQSTSIEVLSIISPPDTF